MENKDWQDIGDFVNVGTGVGLTIKQLAETIRDVVYADSPKRTCRIEWDTTKPNGTPKKLLDGSRLQRLGWKNNKDFKSGIKQSYLDFISNPLLV